MWDELNAEKDLLGINKGYFLLMLLISNSVDVREKVLLSRVN